jgi:hypothetical protein
MPRAGPKRGNTLLGGQQYGAPAGRLILPSAVSVGNIHDHPNAGAYAGSRGGVS